MQQNRETLGSKQRELEMSMYATVELSDSGHQDIPSDLDPDGEGLSYGQNVGQCGAWDELDKIAVNAGARALTSYFFSEEMESDDENWSPVVDGVRTFDVILQSLEPRSKDEPFGRYTVEWIAWDVRAYLSILKKSLSPDERFRLSVG